MNAAAHAAATRATVRAAPEAQYAVLLLDGTRLALPQSDVRASEAAANVNYGARAGHAVGSINAAEALLPVYCIDSELLPLHEVPPARRICVLVETATCRFGVLCDDLRLLPARAVERYELPAAMALPGSLLRGIIVHDGAAIALSSAAALAIVLDVDATAATQ
jgi:hypothetical protein